MTTPVTEYQEMVTAFAEFDAFLAVDGPALIHFLREEEILTTEQIRTVIEKVNSFFTWMLDIVSTFESMVIDLDGLLALAEVYGALLKYLLKVISEVAPNVPNGVAEVLTKLPRIDIDIDLETLGEVLPDPVSVVQLKSLLITLKTKAQDLSGHI